MNLTEAQKEHAEQDRLDYVSHKESHILSRACPVCGETGHPKIRVGYYEICTICDSDKDETICYLLEELASRNRLIARLKREPA